MTCKAENCNEAGMWRERFSQVLCNYHFIMAVLHWLDSRPRGRPWWDEQ
jgi:hypothetical protein